MDNHFSPSQRSSLKDWFSCQQLNFGWAKHIVPHNSTTYLHNPSLNLVTLNADDLQNDTDLNKFGLVYGARQLETLVLDGKLAEVDHEREIFRRLDSDVASTEATDFNNDEMRGRYWAYLSNFPCHHSLSSQAESDALFILELMELQSLTNPHDLPAIPFSMADIKDYKSYLQPSNTSLVPFAKTVIIANILANYYIHRSAIHNLQMMKSAKATRNWFGRTFLSILCCGMPPNHLKRFKDASLVYQQTLQKSQWQYFVDQVKRERGAANIMSGLLLASSVAFLAIPNLVDISQNFILLSVGFSLGAVVMGFNAKLEDELLELQDDLIQDPKKGNEKLLLLANVMERHYTTVLLSVLCFFISVLAFSAYSIYSSVFVQKSFTVRYLFFAIATCGLMAVAGVTLRWNRLVNLNSVE